jgi:hypothetical protein
MNPSVNDTLTITEEITMRVNAFVIAHSSLSISENTLFVINTDLFVYDNISPIEWFYRMPLWLDLLSYEDVLVEETCYQGIFIPEALHVNVDFNDGSEYYVSFSYDIPDGIIYVYQGTQLIFNTAIVFLEEMDVVHISERVTISIV